MEPSARYSRQREAVLKAVKNAHNHPTAEAIYEEVQKTIPNISLGTVYRNLNFLASEGKIRETSLEDDAKRYECDTEDHYHGICESCGAIIDLSLDFEPLLKTITESLRHFAVRSHKLELYGLCEDCQKTE